MTYEINGSFLSDDGLWTVWLAPADGSAEYEVEVSHEECTSSVVRWWDADEGMHSGATLDGETTATVAWYAANDAKVRAAYERDLQDARQERELSDAWGE